MNQFSTKNLGGIIKEITGEIPGEFPEEVP